MDTGTEAQLLYEARESWSHLRRSVDFYDEGLLLWLDADVIICSLSKGTRSLDDFCQRFHGGPNRGPEVKPYVLADVIASLNQTWPYDWAGFIHDRIYVVTSHAPTNGITLKDPDGAVVDVVPGSPADTAGVAPDMKLIAVNGRRYSADVLRAAIAASKQTGHVELMCENKEFYRTFTLDYREGRRHPVLVRDGDVHDYAGEILAPHPH